MSINSSETIKCPQCHQINEVNVWHSITVSDSADFLLQFWKRYDIIYLPHVTPE